MEIERVVLKQNDKVAFDMDVKTAKAILFAIKEALDRNGEYELFHVHPFSLTVEQFNKKHDMTVHANAYVKTGD